MLELLLADSRTPTGGFAHSNGLEPAQLPAAAVPAFVRGRLATVALVDAAVAAAACRGAEPLELDDQWAARTPAPAVRAAARRQGRALLRLADRVWSGRLDSYAAASAVTPRPVVLGQIGALAQLPPEVIARVCLYDDAATTCAAVPKLDAVDAVDVSAWLVELAPLIDSLAARAAAWDELPAAAAPLLDVRAVRHATNSRRLFAT